MTRATTLTDEEKRVAKALLAGGLRNQDVHALINYERPVTINFGRIAGVKKDDRIIHAVSQS
jgi:phosphoribosylanthranilate isomerase